MWEYNEVLHQLVTDFRRTHYSVGSEFLINILTEFGIPKEIVGLIKMYLNEAYNTVRVGKHLSDMVPIKNGWK